MTTPPATRRKWLPIETKVIAAVPGGVIAQQVSEFALWGLGVLFWNAPADAAHASQAMDAVPSPVAKIVTTALVAAGAFLGGYLAPHTSREGI